jgi:anti-sigma-K factor RskA
MSEGDLHLLTGAYASGALSNEEHDAFVEHLGVCANCRDEVAELVATAALLGIAAAERPPAGFRERVMAEVATTRQLPPVVSTLADAKGRRRASRQRRWTLSAAASAVVLAVGLGAWGLSLNEENSDLRRNGDLIEALQTVQTAPDAQTMTAAKGETTASLTMSPSLGQMVFQTHGLKDAGDERTYQVWLLGPGSEVRSMGTFDSNGENTIQHMRGDPRGATALAVTEEPAGGSQRPTTQPVLAMDLPKA